MTDPMRHGPMEIDEQARKQRLSEMFCMTRAEVESLIKPFERYAFGYTEEAQAAYQIVRRMSDWLKATT